MQSSGQDVEVRPFERKSRKGEASPFYDIVILGAGPCGLGAAWAVEQQRRGGKGVSYLLVDASPVIGGSAASVTTPEGFVFDYGGHILYLHEEYTEFIALLDELVGRWHESKPVRGVWIDNRLIPYPVQRNIHRLPPRKFLSALKGLGLVSFARRLGVNRRHRADNLDQHLHARFGGGLTRHVLGPINQKMWAHDPSQLGASWTGHRSGSRVQNVADASVRRILLNMITQQDSLGWAETTRVRYPLRGGTGAIWTNLSKRLAKDAVLSGTRVVEVDGAARTVLLDNGQLISYGSLISSIPLDVFLDLLTENPVPQLAGKLRFAKAAFIGLGLRGEPPPFLDGVHSFHMPEADIPCWRVSFPKNLSPGNVPPGPHWSILCEISLSLAEDFDFVEAEHQIVGQLRRRGILPPGTKIGSRWHSEMRHGYPVPYLGRDEMLRNAQRALQAMDIFSRGRFGGWKYEVSNQDHSFMQGVEAVRLILDDALETTYRSDPT
ncbi:MAG: protoporphyrinogen/coproporphyrinogen oxidase [Gammaproteobacteria bacterium]